MKAFGLELNKSSILKAGFVIYAVFFVYCTSQVEQGNFSEDLLWYWLGPIFFLWFFLVSFIELRSPKVSKIRKVELLLMDLILFLGGILVYLRFQFQLIESEVYGFLFIWLAGIFITFAVLLRTFVYVREKSLKYKIEKE